MPKQTIIKFGISDGKGYRAATWKVVSNSTKSDVYLVCRKLQKNLKVSLHETGNWHMAYTKETGFFENSVKGVIPNQQDRFLDKWASAKANRTWCNLGGFVL